MPRDLFEEAGIQPQQEPRDLFEESGINPSQNQQVSPEMYHRRQSEDTTGFKGIAQDALQSAKGLLSGLGNMALSLPGEAYGAGKQVITNPKRAASNAAAGVLGLPHTILNSPANVADYLARKQLISPHDLHVNNTPTTEEVADIFGIKGNERGDALIRGLAEFAPGAKALKLLGTTGRVADVANAGINAAGENQDPLEAMLLGPAAEGFAKVVGKVAKLPKKLAPSNMLRGGRTPEELAKALAAAQGTNTPLGSVLDHPALKKFHENIVTPVPFSGAEKRLQGVAQEVENRAHNVLENVVRPEGVNGNTNELVGFLLKSAYEQNRKAKNSAWDAFSKRAISEKHNLELPSFKNIVADSSQAIENSPLYMADSDFRSALNKLHGLKKTEKEVKSQIVDESGNPITSKVNKTSPKDALMTANTLSEEGTRLKKSTTGKDKAIGGLYNKLASALRSDVENSVETTGSKELKEEYKRAKVIHKQNYVPFLDKNVHKFLDADYDPESIVSEIVKPSKTSDRSKQIKQITSLLPESKKNLLGYTYLKTAENNLGELDTKKMAALVRSLGQRQFKALFPDTNTREALTNQGRLRGMNEEALNVSHNPKTGVRTLNSIMSGSLGAALYSGNPLAVLATLLPSVAANVANKFLTNEKFRTRLVKKIIKKETKGEPLTKTERAMAEFTKHLNKTPAALRKAAPALELELNQYAGQEEQA